MSALLIAWILGAGWSAQDAAQVAPEPKSDALTVTVPAFSNPNCPIMGKPSSNQLFVDTTLGRVYVCCPPCYKKVLQNEERVVQAAYPVVTPAGNKTCPISGHALPEDPASVVIQGIEVALCCVECAAHARVRPQVTLVLATRPGAREVLNATCPVTDEPAQENLIVLIGDDIVHLSSMKCVEEIEKDPAAALKKAQALAQKEPRARPKPAMGTAHDVASCGKETCAKESCDPAACKGGDGASEAACCAPAACCAGAAEGAGKPGAKEDAKDGGAKHGGPR